MNNLSEPPKKLARHEKAVWREVAPSVRHCDIADRVGFEVLVRMIAALRAYGIRLNAEGPGLTGVQLNVMVGLLDRFGLMPALRVPD